MRLYRRVVMRASIYCGCEFDSAVFLDRALLPTAAYLVCVMVCQIPLSISQAKCTRTWTASGTATCHFLLQGVRSNINVPGPPLIKYLAGSRTHLIPPVGPVFVLVFEQFLGRHLYTRRFFLF